MTSIRIANKLRLNMTKTEFMRISSRQKLHTLTTSLVLSTNGTPINQVSTSNLWVYSLMQTER